MPSTRVPVVFAALLVASLPAIGAARPLGAQNPPPRAPGAPPAVAAPVFDSGATTIPYFPLGTSPLALHGDVRPGTYLSAVGRRAIAMGTEDGRLELWSWPIKWLHDFQLSFRVPKYTAPIRGSDVRTLHDRAPRGRHHRLRLRAVHRPRARLRAARQAGGGDPARGRRHPPARHHRQLHPRHPLRLAGGTRRTVPDLGAERARLPLLRGKAAGQRLPGLPGGDRGIRRSRAHARRRATTTRPRRRERHRAVHRPAPGRAAGAQRQPARGVHPDRPRRRRDASRFGPRAVSFAHRARSRRA